LGGGLTPGPGGVPFAVRIFRYRRRLTTGRSEIHGRSGYGAGERARSARLKAAARLMVGA